MRAPSTCLTSRWYSSAAASLWDRLADLDTGHHPIPHLIAAVTRMGVRILSLEQMPLPAWGNQYHAGVKDGTRWAEGVRQIVIPG